MTPPPLPTLDIAGTRLHMIGLEQAVALAEAWIRQGRPGVVCHVNAQGIVVARRDPELAAAYAGADLAVADGMPLVWLGRRRGFPEVGRVYGPDFMTLLMQRTTLPDGSGPGHFLFGANEVVLEALQRRLEARHPGLRIVGRLAPPFGAWDEAESARHLERINQSGAAVVWVGLGAPKQEIWMARHRSRLTPPLLAGVGAAFDFFAGTKPQAPRWMQRSGLEWLFRLLSEPRRLWPRYREAAPQFIRLTAREWLAGPLPERRNPPPPPPEGG
ncbi:MAG: WecB/TagA/CpsF family glycosyltransferase [Magnetococcales bacterium]|nr:WecB/TagA/CpsF family glycosyltransferase [Magnetococcales bacterium]